MDFAATADIPLGRVDIVDVDDNAAIDLPKLMTIQSVDQFLDGFANQVLAIARYDGGVFIPGLEVTHLIHRNQQGFLSESIANPSSDLMDAFQRRVY